MIEVISDLQGLRALQDAWNRLAGASDSPLLQFDWFYHCAENLCKEEDLRIFIYREAAQLKAIAPLVKVIRANIPWLEVIGSAQLYEPSGLLFAGPRALHTLMRAIARQGLPVNLQRIPVESPICKGARAACRGLAAVIRRPTAGSCYIPIDTRWDSFYQAMGKKWRADFRNKKHRAEKLGVVSVDIVCPKEDELAPQLEECFRIEAASWKSRNGTALRDNPPMRAFFQRYAASAARQEMLRLCFYRVDGQAVAMHMGVEFKNRLWFYKMGYDEAWSRISPGMQLAHETIAYAVGKSLAGYEFLGSEEAWQHAWPAGVHEYCSVVIFPISLHGARGLWTTGVAFVRNRMRATRPPDPRH